MNILAYDSTTNQVKVDGTGYFAPQWKNVPENVATKDELCRFYEVKEVG